MVGVSTQEFIHHDLWSSIFRWVINNSIQLFELTKSQGNICMAFNTELSHSSYHLIDLRSSIGIRYRSLYPKLTQGLFASRLCLELGSLSIASLLKLRYDGPMNSQLLQAKPTLRPFGPLVKNMRMTSFHSFFAQVLAWPKGFRVQRTSSWELL
mgnify:CR=1 FL=1